MDTKLKKDLFSNFYLFQVHLRRQMMGVNQLGTQHTFSGKSWLRDQDQEPKAHMLEFP